MVAPSVVAAVEKVVPKVGERSPSVCSRAVDERP
jgi:hypothetical protein